MNDQAQKFFRNGQPPQQVKIEVDEKVIAASSDALIAKVKASHSTVEQQTAALQLAARQIAEEVATMRAESAAAAGRELRTKRQALASEAREEASKMPQPSK